MWNDFAALNAVFEASRWGWLIFEQWDIVFQNAHLMQRCNTYDVPTISEGVWRIDNTYNRDFNVKIPVVRIIYPPYTFSEGGHIIRVRTLQ